jgi:hypothetical protein
VTRLHLAWLLALACAGCPDPEATVDGDVLDREAFDAVSPVLEEGCGSLDCHGDLYRNYRLHGYGGRRLDPSHRPDSPATTPAEIAANHDATVGLEPELIGDVDLLGELTIVRKARGAEQHEGGAPFPPDGPAERCLLSWLAGGLDAPACAAATTR